MNEQFSENEKPVNEFLGLVPTGHAFDSSPLSSLLRKAGLTEVTGEEITEMAKETLRLLLNTSPDGRLWTEPKNSVLLEYFFGLRPEINPKSEEISGLVPTERPKRAPSIRLLAEDLGCHPDSLKKTIDYCLAPGLMPMARFLLYNRPAREKTVPVTVLKGGIFRVTKEHQIVIYHGENK